MIKAVIFDCFGVLTTEALLPFRHKYFAPGSEAAQEAVDLTKQATAGLISQTAFIDRLAEMAQLTPRQVRIAVEGNVPNDALFDYIAQTLRPRYKIGLLSNAASNRLDRLFKPEQLALFDAITLSYETGAIKPQPQAYHFAVERLGLAPEDCVLVDDQPAYCSGARAVGLRAVQYDIHEKAIAELEHILHEGNR